MMVCRNCGAEIDDKATSCPYCNAMQYDASEAEYMNNLYKMNSQMDNLDDEANKYVFSSVLKECRNHNYMYCGSCFNWDFLGIYEVPG